MSNSITPPLARGPLSWCRAAVTVTLLLFVSGCASFQSLGFHQAEGDPTAPPTKPPRGMIAVSLQADGEMPEKTEFPLDDSTSHVQAALVKGGAYKKFRRIKIHLVRSLPNGRRHKMDIPFDASNHVVPLEYDYALRPDDHLIVIEDTTTMFSEMLDSAGGQLGVLGRVLRR